MQSKEKEAGPEPIEVAVRSWLAGIRVSAATKETYARAIKPFAGFLEAGGIGLEDARRRDVERYVDGLMEDGPSLRPRRAVPRGRQIALLIPLGIGLQKPSRRGSRPENEQDVQRDSLTRDQVSELLSSMRRETPIQKRNFAMVNLMVRTGCATSRWCAPTYATSAPAWAPTFSTCKARGRPGKDSFVVLTPAAMGPISEYLVTRSSRAPRRLCSPRGGRDCGGRMSTRTVSRVAKDSMRRAGIDDRWHTAHSAAPYGGHARAARRRRGARRPDDGQARRRVHDDDIRSHIDRIANAAEKSVDALPVAVEARR